MLPAIWVFHVSQFYGFFYFFSPKPDDECNFLLGTTIVYNCKLSIYRRVLMPAEWIMETWLWLCFSKEKFLLQLLNDCQSATVSKKNTANIQIRQLKCFLISNKLKIFLDLAILNVSLESADLVLRQKGEQEDFWWVSVASV